jgi:hypothetical protein
VQPLKNLKSLERAAPFRAGLREDNGDDSEECGPDGNTSYNVDIPTLILDKLPAQIVLDISKINTAIALAFYIAQQLFPFSANYHRLQDNQRTLPDIGFISDFILDALAAWNVLHPSDCLTFPEFFVLLEKARQTIINDNNDRTEASCYG